MNQEEMLREISSLERKVNLLLAEHVRLKEQLDHKTQENAELRSRVKSQETRLHDFQNQHNISKIVNNMADGEEDARELRYILDEYINEIDKCIAHLGEA